MHTICCNLVRTLKRRSCSCVAKTSCWWLCRKTTTLQRENRARHRPKSISREKWRVFNAKRVGIPTDRCEI